jgi:urea transport system ATP-binding protein
MTGTAAGRALLEVRGLTVSFDGFKAIDDLDLTVDEGELRFLIGPNGAGKTTLLDVVTGLTRAAAGTVRFAGEEITGRREHAVVHRGIGRSFQTPTIFESLTVVENLDLAESFRRRFVSRLRVARRASALVGDTLDRIGLRGQATRPAGVLSHGQRQWLEIGMLLVQRPRLLLLDEPVAGMSARERADTGALLEELAADHTVVVIEHDMGFLRRYARKVTVLHEGRLLTEGSVEEVQSDPRVKEVYLGRSHERDVAEASAAVAAAIRVTALDDVDADGVTEMVAAVAAVDVAYVDAEEVAAVIEAVESDKPIDVAAESGGAVDDAVDSPVDDGGSAGGGAGPGVDGAVDNPVDEPVEQPEDAAVGAAPGGEPGVDAAVDNPGAGPVDGAAVGAGGPGDEVDKVGDGPGDGVGVDERASAP